MVRQGRYQNCMFKKIIFANRRKSPLLVRNCWQSSYFNSRDDIDIFVLNDKDDVGNLKSLVLIDQLKG